jgi:lipoprotein NlpD
MPPRLSSKRHAPVIGTVLLLLCVTLGGCAGTGVVAPLGRAPPRNSAPAPAPAPGRADVHAVQPGETLYAIAWRYGLDYRDLAQWNAVAEPFTIFSGQRLRVTRPAVMPARVAPAPAPQPPRQRAQVSAPRPAPASPAPSTAVPRARAPAPSGDAAAVDDRTIDAWSWPTRGPILGSFGKDAGKGIDIGGSRGSAITAAAPGYVVYSGSGLRGYGKLIIVKHNKRYLSAYAHNDHLHAKEGDTVNSGQRIADMGSTDSKVVKLHFEIRRDGQPVDPARYLPR